MNKIRVFLIFPLLIFIGVPILSKQMKFTINCTRNCIVIQKPFILRTLVIHVHNIVEIKLKCACQDILLDHGVVAVTT